MYGARRLQINLDMEPVSSYPLLKDLPKAILPMLWLEERIAMNKTYVDEMKIMILLVSTYHLHCNIFHRRPLIIPAFKTSITSFDTRVFCLVSLVSESPRTTL